MTNKRRRVNGQVQRQKELVAPIGSTAFAAALMGGIITWAKRQDMTERRDPAYWSDSLRVFLRTYKREYPPQ